MRQLSTLIFCISTLFASALCAQTGCPGCVVNLPAGLPDDTLYIQSLPDGVEWSDYDQDISFRMPKTTTPVHAIDSTTPPGFTITKIEILSIEGVPPGLYWQPSQWVFETATETDGCVKFCGKPTVSDSFVMTVNIKATVIFLTQEASFPLKIYIAPEISATEGFTMTDFTGCGATTASFTNNIPSGGAPGFTYEWDFGDGTTFVGENPPPHTYSAPGIYPVTYHATVDTVGYVLESITLIDVACDDNLNNPDLFFFVYDPDAEEVFDSSPHIQDTPLPYTFPIGLLLGAGNYSLVVWDEDSGLKGADDLCGAIPFNILSNGTLSAGGLTVTLNIVHEVKEINSTDTVYVYFQPAQPFIDMPNGLTACEGSDSLLLVSSAGAGNQWWFEGHPIPGANDFIYEPMQNGYYQVEVKTSFGCSTISDSALVQIFPQPALPAYINVNNSLRLADTTALPDEYALQWYNGDDPIPGETGFRYCATENGNYGLLVTDLSTGCTNFYVTPVIYDPEYDCTIGTDEAQVPAFGIFPNPASGTVQIRLNRTLSEGGQLRVWDAAGRLVKRMFLLEGIENQTLECGEFNTGFFTVEIISGSFRATGKLAVMR